MNGLLIGYARVSTYEQDLTANSRSARQLFTVGRATVYRTVRRQEGLDRPEVRALRDRFRPDSRRSVAVCRRSWSAGCASLISAAGAGHCSSCSTVHSRTRECGPRSSSGSSTQLDVIAWDAPGCGASDDVPPTWDDAAWADAASGFITALGLSHPAVAGFSLGSVIALLLARNHPDSVGRLVLVGAYAGWGGSLSPDELAERIAAARFTMDHPAAEWAEDFLDSVFAPGTDSEHRAHARSLPRGLAARHHGGTAARDGARPAAGSGDDPNADTSSCAAPPTLAVLVAPQWSCASFSARSPPRRDRRSRARLHRPRARCGAGALVARGGCDRGPAHRLIASPPQCRPRAERTGTTPTRDWQHDSSSQGHLQRAVPARK